MHGFGDIQVLAQQYGTPLIIYSEASLVKNVLALRSALPALSHLAYSIKANPNPTILRLLVERFGLMAEAASAGELTLAIRCGVPPNNLLLGGPAKTREAIELAAEAQIAGVLIESSNDLNRAKLIAKERGVKLNILFRLNPAYLESSSVLRMSGKYSQFGIDEDSLFQIIKECEEDSAQYAGLFLYAGSQHFLAKYIVENTRYLCRIAHRLHAKGLPPPRILDFGGGFGVPETDHQPELNLERLREGLDRVFQEELSELFRQGLERTIFESGRYLVSQAGIYVTRVMDVKRSHGKLFAILDGGINNMGIRQLKYRTFEPKIEVWGKDGDQQSESITLAGPTCTPIDIVHQGIRLGNLEVGDLVIIRDFGAYTVNFSPIHFCGHPWPAEVLVTTDGNVRLVRRRGLLSESCGLGYIDVDDGVGL